MSGAEIAGFLLAGPPLLISWLEHYREVFEICGCWRRFRNEYRKAETQLQALDLSFDLTLEKLYLPYVESLEKLKRLKSDWRDEVWIDAEENLRKRLLPEVYKVYMNLYKDLREAMVELESALGYDKQKFQLALNFNVPSPGNPQKPSRATKMQRRAVYELERVKFSTHAKPREAATKRVEQILEQIQRLLVQNDEAATTRANLASKSSAKVQSTLLHFWKHARAVYDLITITWSCACRQRHCADLLLVHRTLPDSTLDLWFRYALPLPDKCPWTILPAQIRRVDLPDEPKPAPKVRFSISKSPKPVSTIDSPPITDLCRTLSKVKTGRRAIGLICANGSDHGYSLLKPEHSAHTDVITLGSLLRLNTWERPDRKQRYRIAATIASSHLQLHSSGWLCSGWNKDDIHFPLVSGKPSFEELYLRKSFDDTQTNANNPSFDIAFTTLGVLLLELVFGLTLEKTPYWNSYKLSDGTSNLVQDRLAAWDWAEQVAGEADERWAYAIEWCLGKWKVREADNTWRQEFYQVVIDPLRTEAGLS